MKQELVQIEVESNSGMVETSVIKGDLDCIIINPLGRTEIRIESILGYLIYESKEITGLVYIPIRLSPQDSLGHKMNFQAEKFKLNETLIIKVLCYGYEEINKNEVEILIRYD